ncbi:MAG: serine hydrolase [Ignavibacteriales bacterium]|nr:serine hydrolase [Ignavibacteriales bacterium]
MPFISRKFAFIAFTLLVGAWLSGCAPQPVMKERAKAEWIEQTLKRLTLEEKISQMIMSRAYGYYYSNESDEFRRLDHLVKDHKVGGLIFFQGDVFETATLVNRMQERADVPLLIASDFEWGTAMRIRRATRFPEAMALGATRDTLLAFQLGKATGEETRAIGVHVDFAPVADVNVNPNNPVINTRSFGENPNLVGDMAKSFAAGLQSAGVLATAKHFPGHGDTQVDSHLDLPRITVSRGRLDSVELIPFKSVIDRGIAAVMIAHLEVPAVESNSALPATLSPTIIQGLLRRELGFNGLVVTDALDMGAVVKGFGSDSAAVRAVEAGADILLIPQDEDEAVTAVMNGVRAGRIPQERINTSVRKILGYKWDLGLAQKRTIDMDKIPDVVATPQHLSLAKQIARKSITVLKNDSILPLPRFDQKKILNVVVADQENYRTEIHRSSSQWPNEPVGEYFNVQFRKRYLNLQTAHVDPSSDSLDFLSILKKAKSSDVIVCPVFSKARSGSGQFGFPQELIKFVNDMIALKKPTIMITMGSPYILNVFPNANAYLCSYSDAEVSTEATLEALFGEVPASGRLPVTIPDMFPYGSGIDVPQSVVRRDFPEALGFDRDSLTRIDSIIAKAIHDSAFPGAQVLVAKDGAIVYNKSFGTLEYSTSNAHVSTNTMYDLASLTKVVATTSAIMKLYDEGKIQLDDKVIKYIPEFANHGKGTITLRNLLSHTGGLPPFKRLFLTCKSPQEVLDSVYQTEMMYKPGDSTVYSDFDFILLGKIIERVTGVPLDRYVDSTFFKPLGMTSTMFNPSKSLWENIAPTEFDSAYRKQLVRGVVHDENAYALGGISGHAGLFSTASNLAVFMQMVLNEGSYGGRQYLNSQTIRLFTTKQNSKSTRALGWDTKTINGYSTAGKLFGETSFGHTGFTGTSIWADPAKKIFVIFLTNRVYPTRGNTRITPVRPAVHDAVIRALISNTPK